MPFYLADPYRKNIAGLVSDAFCGLGLYKEALRPAIVSLAVARQEQEMQQAKERIWLIWPRVSASERKSEGEGIASVLDSTVWAARLHFALGDALQKSGFIPEAENQFWRGLKIQPDHDRAYLHLGEIYQNNYHKKTTAVLFYMKYLRYADDPVIKARLMRLSSEFARKRDIALRMKNYINKGT